MFSILGELIKDYEEQKCEGSCRTLLKALQNDDLELAQEIIPVSKGVFEEVQREYRFLTNRDSAGLRRTLSDPTTFLPHVFPWADTAQGFKYWHKVHEAVARGESLPEEALTLLQRWLVACTELEKERSDAPQATA